MSIKPLVRKANHGGRLKYHSTLSQQFLNRFIFYTNHIASVNPFLNKSCLDLWFQTIIKQHCISEFQGSFYELFSLWIHPISNRFYQRSLFIILLGFFDCRTLYFYPSYKHRFKNCNPSGHCMKLYIKMIRTKTLNPNCKFLFQCFHFLIR